MEKNRPRGVIIYGVVLIIISLILFLSSFMVTYYIKPNAPSPYWLNVAKNLFTLSPFIIIFLSAGLGLLALKSWARKLVLYLLVPFFCIFIPFEYRDVINDYWLSWFPALIPFLFGVSLLIYFSRSKVKEQFS